MREIRMSGLMKGNNEKGIAYNRHSLFSILLVLKKIRSHSVDSWLKKSRPSIRSTTTSGGGGANDLIVVSGTDLMSGGNQEKVFVPLSG